MKNKYKNKEIFIDGIKFDSKKEGLQYLIYKNMKKKGLIKDFKMQVLYKLIPSQKVPGTKRVIEIPVTYRLDFLITHNDDSLEHIDVKAWDKKTNKFLTTPDYIIKRKLMLYVHNIKINEI